MNATIEVNTEPNNTMRLHQQLASGQLDDGTEFQVIQCLSSNSLVFKCRNTESVIMTMGNFIDMALRVVGLSEFEKGTT